MYVTQLSDRLVNLMPVIQDPTSWMRYVVCKVGLKKLDATLVDTRYDFSSLSYIIKKLIPHLPYEMTPYIA